MPLMGTLLSLPQTFSKVTDCIGTFNYLGSYGFFRLGSTVVALTPRRLMHIDL